MKKSLGKPKRKAGIKYMTGMMSLMLGLSAASPAGSMAYAANYEKDLPLNDTYQKSVIAEKDDADYYDINLPSDGRLTLTVMETGLDHGVYELRNSDSSYTYFTNEHLFVSTEADPDIDTTSVVLRKGNYRLKVYGRWGHVGKYEIKASFKAITHNEIEPNDSPDEAMTVNEGEMITGLRTGEQDLDYYKISIPRNMDVTMTFVNKMEFLYYTILDENHLPIVKGQGISAGSEDQPYVMTKDISLDKGTYYISFYPASSASLYISDNNGQYQFKWDETAIPVAGLTLSGSDNIKQGETTTLKANVLPADASNKNLKWTSSDTSVAVVDTNGEVTGINEGTATIKAETTDGSNKSDSMTIKVSRAAVNKVTVTGSKSVKVGDTITLKAKAYPNNLTQSFNWSSSNKSIAKVDNTGKVTGVKAGKVTITATAKDGSKKSGSIEITVKKADESKLVKKVTSVKSISQGSKKVKVSWKKQNSAKKYEVQVATNKKFTKNLVSKTADYKKSNLTVKCKKTGTTYIRVRAIDRNGRYGAWSEIKNLKVK